MGFSTYILISESNGRLYIGHSEHVKTRLEQHNSNKSKSTRLRGPWKLLHSVEFATRQEAVQLELKLKRWKSSKRVLAWIDRQKGLGMERPDS